ncbi:hypothetical protein [Corallococcus sp. 4LFB]|uniref:hypothetical protein n=1 Tax=Corallococcus sp. 4LFB TaxID=3383249 RepID=UPI003976D19D
MTTCTDNTKHTEADVERLGKLARLTLFTTKLALNHAVPGGCWATGPNTGDPVEDLVTCPGCAALTGIEALLDGNLASLVAAALEGAKVPGLVEQLTLERHAVDTLFHATKAGRVGKSMEGHLRSVERVMEMRDDPAPGAAVLLSVQHDLSALHAQVATLTAERDEARDEVERVDRLYDEVADVLDAAGIPAREDGAQQAERVKELVAGRDEWKRRAEERAGFAQRVAHEKEVAESERDALRAQVDSFHRRLTRLDARADDLAQQAVGPKGFSPVADVIREIASDLLDALSARPRR